MSMEFAVHTERLASFIRTGRALEASPDFLEKLPLAIYACDADGRMLWYNTRAAELWGRMPRIGDDSERFCGSHRLYFGGRQIGREETPMASVLRTGVPIRGVEGRVERPDGSCIWVMVHIEPVEDDDGVIVGAINCFHETTTLHHEADDFEGFFENSAVALALVSGNGTILRANRAELEMLGYRAEEYVGRNITDFHVDRTTIDDILTRLHRNEQPYRRPARLRAKDGSIRHVLITPNVRTRNGEFMNIRCFTVDVTERVRAEELLQQQNERLAATYEHAGMGIVEVDAEGKLLRVNAQLCALMGYAPEELLGRSIFDETYAADIEPDREQFHRQVAGEIDRYSIEKRISRRNGDYLWASITSSSVRDAEGRFLYAVRVQHDIGDRKRAQDSLASRMEEQAALYEFTNRLQRAKSLADLYEPALDAILRALRCHRASILLFDQSGVMSFVSSRGLSEDYRRAVDGHSPWTPDVEDPQPICLHDIENADLPEYLKQTVRAEGIGALAFIPLQENGQLLGKFMAYYDVPHVFADTEIDLAVTIGRQLGFGVARMRAEAARQRAEQGAQHLVSIVESSDDAIISKDLDGVIRSWNNGAERLFGYSADEAIGRPVTILIPPDRLDEEPGILARIRRGERVDHYETVRCRKDGSPLDISLTVSPVRDAKGKIVGASKIARDISDRRAAEAKLRESQRRLEELLAAIPAAIYTTDAQGKITYYNEAAVDLAGRTPTIGSDEWCVTWKLYRPDGTPLPHDQCPMAVALKEGRPIRNAEAIAERPDGVRIPFIPYPTPLRDAKGEIVGAINMLVDISERKQAETQQRILLNELNHRVKNNMQMMQSLLYSASKQTQSAEARKVLGEAGGRIAAMAAAQRVLYDTTDATRFSAQAFLDAVCQTARQMFPTDVKIICKSAAVELSNDAAMPLALVVNELLTNAVKHGLEGRAEGVIHVGLTQKADSFLLYVEDDGPGFDLELVRNRSSGLRLVQGLARQLRAHFEVTRNPTRCSLQFSQDVPP
jgi:PAS domain S-box-containing protein